MYQLLMEMIDGSGYQLIPGFIAVSMLLFRCCGLTGLKWVTAGRRGFFPGSGYTTKRQLRSR